MPSPVINRRVLFQPRAVGGVAAWSPLDLSPMIWLDATQLGLSNGAAVAQFTDLSGNGRHFVQATEANKPQYVSSGINSMPCVRSDAVNDHMTLAAFGTQASWWAMLVFKQLVTTAAEKTFWAISDYPSSTNYKLMEKNSGLEPGPMCYMNCNPPGVNGSLFETGVTHAVFIAGSASGMTLRDEDGHVASNAQNHSRDNNMMRLFGRGDGNYSGIDVGELIFGSGALSTDELTELWTYLSNKWGTAIP